MVIGAVVVIVVVIVVVGDISGVVEIGAINVSVDFNVVVGVNSIGAINVSVMIAVVDVSVRVLVVVVDLIVVSVRGDIGVSASVFSVVVPRSLTLASSGLRRVVVASLLSVSPSAGRERTDVDLASVFLESLSDSLESFYGSLATSCFCTLVS